MNSRETKNIIVRGLNVSIVSTIEAEARRQKLSRNDYLKLMIETTAENIESGKAASVLAIPLQQVTRQLNTLTKAQNENTHVVDENFTEFADKLDALNESMANVLTAVNGLKNTIEYSNPHRRDSQYDNF